MGVIDTLHAMKLPRHLYLFDNGNVMAFDGNGKQMPTLQGAYQAARQYFLELDGPMPERLECFLARGLTMRSPVTLEEWLDVDRAKRHTLPEFHHNLLREPKTDLDCEYENE